MKFFFVEILVKIFFICFMVEMKIKIKIRIICCTRIIASFVFQENVHDALNNFFALLLEILLFFANIFTMSKGNILYIFFSHPLNGIIEWGSHYLPSLHQHPLYSRGRLCRPVAQSRFEALSVWRNKRFFLKFYWKILDFGEKGGAWYFPFFEI